MRAWAGPFFVAFTTACGAWRGPPLPEDHHERYGCVDVAIGASHDVRVPATSLVLDLEMENECHRAVPVDVSKLDVWVEGPGDARSALGLYDPKHEIGPLHIAPGAVAHERIQADGAGDPGAATALCFDASPALGVGQGAPRCFTLGAATEGEAR